MARSVKKDITNLHRIHDQDLFHQAWISDLLDLIITTPFLEYLEISNKYAYMINCYLVKKKLFWIWAW